MSKAIVDTGASRSFVSQDIFSNIKAEQRKGIKINENKISLVMKTPLGTVYSDLDSFEGKVTMHDSDKVLNETFAVLPKAPEGPILLGMTFLVKARAEIRAFNQSVTFGHFTNHQGQTVKLTENPVIQKKIQFKKWTPHKHKSRFRSTNTQG